MPGVDSYDVSLETQQVIVKGSAPYDLVLEKIKKTGKEVGELFITIFRSSSPINLAGHQRRGACVMCDRRTTFVFPLVT